ncbi:uracil phosphoribosyltransferase [uncultured Winogradskyella sp.]|uniref:uracil phosphoribosyltransferase n=1 Tax=uncultured Winogradskyella sp. TaxID=395353 RepID=UPI0035154521
MKIHNLTEKPSILNTFISELRDASIQKDRMRFRKNIERIGEIFSYELSKSLAFERKVVTTPLGNHASELPQNNIVICSILRAGLPLHIGLLNYFDRADSAFISAYRKHNQDQPSTFKIKVEYLACPNLNGKTLILADPMLATGQSIISVLKALEPYGMPEEIHLVSIIGALPGVTYISEQLPQNVHLWIGAIDKELNNRSYIVPGLGDAGDLSFGEKLQQ